MVRALAEASGLAVVVGPAGAGKTAALAAAVRVWAAQGRPVLGGAVAAVTARRLEHATGATSSSLARLLAQIRRRDEATGLPIGLPAGGVLVVDEASMADTRTLAELLARTRAAGGTLVLVGDPAQLPEIGAGGLFTALARHPDTVVLTDNRRQTRGMGTRSAGRPARRRPRRRPRRLRPPRPRPHRARGRAARAGSSRTTCGSRERPVTADRPTSDATTRVVMLAVRRVDVTVLNDARARPAARCRPARPGRGHRRAGDRAREYRAGDLVLVQANDHRSRPAQRQPGTGHRRRPRRRDADPGGPTTSDT